ncbi:hypothetical protein [Microbacterium sp. CPCC 204701]|uniref:hypothetical protein n=1 Tax=Microbacterium sp. CPCC 204701 TaxID=2493084 RepID=UPI000FDBF98F|nr:hypothetical protein [Microbacterium sp. CPCC 204701]
MRSISRRRRTGATLLATSLAMVAVSVVGLGSLASAQPAAAADEGLTDSAVTVKWAGGNDPELQQYQPDRSAMVDNADGSGHWNDFKDLEVTVSKTENLRDEAITVSVSGFAESTHYSGNGSSNFVQMMQCWGDPASDDFAETCQFGGHHNSTGDTRAAEPFTKLLGRGLTAISRDLTVPGRDDGHHAVPFQSVVGTYSEYQEIPGVTPNAPTVTVDGTAQFFSAGNTNEVPIALIDRDGTASITFLPQSAAAQPYLGCGDRSSKAGDRCWLVIVPRGTHSGTLEGAARPCQYPFPAEQYNGFGETPLFQLGSPISRNCSFWDNRVVVPLQFDDPFASCAQGAERGMVGSELAVGAVSSWQSTLCAGEDPSIFNLSTAPGDAARQQLIGGQADMVLVSEALRPDTIGSANPARLEEMDLAYAPVANTALTIAFSASNMRQLHGNLVHRDLKLTPRLLAKLMTQSYAKDLPARAAGYFDTVSDSREHLPIDTIDEDPEWIALGNPTTFVNFGIGAWVVPGPHGDDAVRALWEYILADADAVAFLNGQPDPWGTTVNRYYLPPTHPDALGGGYDLLSGPIDNFPKADPSYTPNAEMQAQLGITRTLDAVAASPYSGSLAANGSRVVRGDKQISDSWEPLKRNAAGDLGDWETNPPENLANGRLIIGPTTASSAEDYLTDTATLALPSAELSSADAVLTAKTFVAYSPESMRAALGAATVDEFGVASLDFASFPRDAYPLTMTVNAAVDLASSQLDLQARAEYAHFLEYAATTGNVVADTRGALPAGYVPLTDTQTEATLALAQRLRESPTESSDPSPAPPTTSAGTAAPPSSPDAGGTSATQISADSAPTVEATSSTVVPAQGALGATLVAGLAGALASPFLLRRRHV